MHRKREGFKDEIFFTVPDKFLQTIENKSLLETCWATMIGYFPLAAQHFRQRQHGSDDYLLMYCVGGDGSVQVGENAPTYSLSSGQFTVLPPHKYHRYHSSRDNPWTIYWVHLQGTQIAYLWQQGLVGQSQPLLSEGCLLLENLFQESLSILQLKYTPADFFYFCQIISHMLGVICHFATDTEVTEKGEQAVTKAISYMKENLHGSVSLQELSEVTHYSPSHLNHLFQRSKQSSPIEYFLQMKLQDASRVLYFTNLPIKDIAIRYGFKDPLYFSRLFKKTFGLSPTAYRKQQIG